MRNTNNLNYQLIPLANGGWAEQVDYTRMTQQGGVIFRDHDLWIRKLVRASEIVVGCIAWMTHPDLLRFIAKESNGCSFIVNKEDFLRKDSIEPRKDWMVTMRERYEGLPGVSRSWFPSPLGEASVHTDDYMDPVRCFGRYYERNDPAYRKAKMHHKFAVFCRLEWHKVVPISALVGSWNWTKTAGDSKESLVYLTQEDLVMQMFREYCQIAAMSEPLDWVSSDPLPEYRIGGNGFGDLTEYVESGIQFDDIYDEDEDGDTDLPRFWEEK